MRCSLTSSIFGFVLKCCFTLAICFEKIPSGIAELVVCLKGALCCFEDEIQTQNSDIYNINEVIIQTQKCLLFPCLNKQAVLRGIFGSLAAFCLISYGNEKFVHFVFKHKKISL